MAERALGAVQQFIETGEVRSRVFPILVEAIQSSQRLLVCIGGGRELRNRRPKWTDIQLAGDYGIDSEQIDLHGAARLQAKVSQTMTGWKRIALKPIDPFFAKDGVGTVLPIQVTGSRSAPKFGLDRKKKDEPQSADRASK